MNNPGYVALWEFHIKPEAKSAFEEIYGPDGAWAQLFRRSPDYLGTKLIRDITRPGRYLTLDYWTSREAFHGFKQEHRTDYAALNLQCEALTAHEGMVGEFVEVAAEADR